MSKTLKEIANNVEIELRTDPGSWFWSEEELYEVARRYAKEQNKELVNMLEELYNVLAKNGTDKWPTWSKSKQLLTKYKKAMTAKEKAIELVEKLYNETAILSKDTAWQCALLHVKLIIELLESIYDVHLDIDTQLRIEYYQSVLTELNQM